LSLENAVGGNKTVFFQFICWAKVLHKDSTVVVSGRRDEEQ